jgi:hypothetical protein
LSDSLKLSGVLTGIMTIALGTLCSSGLIVAADTNVVMSDGSKTQGCKVATAYGRTGSYVIANAAEDGNAANTLVGHILADLKNKQPDSLSAVESIVADRLTSWAGAFYKPPSIQLALGAMVAKECIAGFPDEGGLGLYFCEPPNTVLRKGMFDDSRGYVAIGSGATYTDPIYKMLFSFAIKTQRKRLLEIAYLMYRAKKDAAFCGGYTNAIWLKREHVEPVWIRATDMERAEAMGPSLDFLLNGTAAAVQQHTEESIKSFVGTLGEMVVNVGSNFRGLKFYSKDGEEIL